MRQENLQSRKMAIEEELEMAVKKVAECRGVLQKARDQVRIGSLHIGHKDSIKLFGANGFGPGNCDLHKICQSL